MRSTLSTSEYRLSVRRLSYSALFRAAAARRLRSNSPTIATQSCMITPVRLCALFGPLDPHIHITRTTTNFKTFLLKHFVDHSTLDTWNV